MTGVRAEWWSKGVVADEIRAEPKTGSHQTSWVTRVGTCLLLPLNWRITEAALQMTD